MKQIDISKQVMRSVSEFETKRSSKTILKYTVIFTILLGVLFIVGSLIVQQLSDQDSFSLLTILTQDREVMMLFWKDSLSTFVEELPQIPVSLSILCGMSILLISVVGKRKFFLAIRRLKNIKIMPVKKSPFHSLPFAIILGVAIAAIFVIFIFIKYSNKPVVTNPSIPATSETTMTPTVTQAVQQDSIPNEPIQAPVSQGLILRISTPQDGTTVATNSVVVKGITSPDAEIFVNDKSASADSKGNFSITVSLDEGENIVSVSANDADGNFASQEFIVTYTPAT